MKTDLEKQLWRMLYKSQIALANVALKELNANRQEEEDWPGGMRWNECNGSSHAIFFRMAREVSGISHEEYLTILRNDEDALNISEEELELSYKI